MLDFFVGLGAAIIVLMTKIIILSIFLACIVFTTTAVLEVMGFFQ